MFVTTCTLDVSSFLGESQVSRGCHPAAVEAVRFGLAIRAVRRERGWTQAELALRARVSQAPVSRAERGSAWQIPVRTLTRIADALGARVAVRLLWQGEALDRLLDAAHAGLVDDAVTILTRHGWEVVPEATFSVFGERGSIDVLAFHPATGALLVIEVKSTVPDMQAMLASIDRKVRLAPRIAAERGWQVRSVSRLLVLPDDRTSRRRVASHAATIDRMMPFRTAAVRRGIASPGGAMGGVLFLSPTRRTAPRHRVARRRRSPQPRRDQAQ